MYVSQFISFWVHAECVQCSPPEQTCWPSLSICITFSALLIFLFDLFIFLRRRLSRILKLVQAICLHCPLMLQAEQSGNNKLRLYELLIHTPHYIWPDKGGIFKSCPRVPKLCVLILRVGGDVWRWLCGHVCCKLLMGDWAEVPNLWGSNAF